MKLKTLFILFILTSSTISYGRTIVNGYYVTQNGDTVKSKFFIKDLFDLHRQVICIDSLDNQKVLSPYDIKSFSFRITHYIDDSKEVNDVDHTSDKVLIDKGYLYRRKSFSLDAEINASPFLGDSVEDYKSIDIGDGKKLFLSVDNNKNKFLFTAVYYTKLDVDKPYLTSSIWLLIKDNQVIRRGNKKLNEWVSETINEYKTLSLLVKNKRIKAFPWDFNLVVNDYNRWLESNRPDTTFYLKGLLDAQKHYKTLATFSLTYLTGTAFFLPGLITAVIVSHNPKEDEIKIPKRFQLKDNKDYVNGFQHKAYDKKYRAAGKGAIFGGLTCILLLIVLH